jgi:hypothetical protein
VTVEELIELLEDCPEGAEVQLATQPGWRLAFSLHGVVSEDDGVSDAVVWLVASGEHLAESSPYAPGHLWEVAVR